MENSRVVTPDARGCGRLKDVYFDDESWSIRHLVAGLDRAFGGRPVLLDPADIHCFSDHDLVLKHPAEVIMTRPLAATVLPVSQQYAALSLGSPGGRAQARGVINANPHLRSARSVMNYLVNAPGEQGGALADLLFDDAEWSIRYLAVEQVLHNQRVTFHLLPQSVERFTWATQRLLLRDLQPVVLAETATSLSHVA